MLENIINQVTDAVTEIINSAKLNKGDVIVIGCSSSEVGGGTIGKNSSEEIGLAIAQACVKITKAKGIFIAAQCCEHLNRALIVEEEYAKSTNSEIVSVVPKIKAGGSFATAVYGLLQSPVAIESIKADAGLDIGSTLIGMHLKAVAVPLRLQTKQIGEAYVTAAKTRYKYIGGERAEYK